MEIKLIANILYVLTNLVGDRYLGWIPGGGCTPGLLTPLAFVLGTFFGVVCSFYFKSAFQKSSIATNQVIYLRIIGIALISFIAAYESMALYEEKENLYVRYYRDDSGSASGQSVIIFPVDEAKKLWHPNFVAVNLKNTIEDHGPNEAKAKDACRILKRLYALEAGCLAFELAFILSILLILGRSIRGNNPKSNSPENTRQKGKKGK